MKAIWLLLSVFVFFKDGKWGLCDADGKVVKEAVFDEIGDPGINGHMVARFEHRYCLLDSAGEFVLKPEFDTLFLVSDSLLIARKDSSYLFCNTKGEELEDSHFSSFVPFEKGTMLLLSKNHKKGMLMDRRALIPVYESINRYREFWMVEKDGFKGLVSGNLKPVLSPVFSRIEAEGSFIIAEQNNLYGLYTSDGRQLFPPVFRAIRLHNGNYMAGTDSTGEAKVYSLSAGKPVLKGNYNEVTFCTEKEDLFFVTRNGYKGAVMKSGKVVVPLKYYGVNYAGMNLVAAEDSSGHHLYNLEGRKLNKIPLGDIDYFDSVPVTSIRFREKFGAVNTKGVILLPPRYSSVHISKDRIYYSDGSRRHVIVFDKNGDFYEEIRNFGMIKLADTTRKRQENRQVKILRNPGNRYGLTELVREISYPSVEGPSARVPTYYLYDSTINRSCRSSISFLDISMDINAYELAPAITSEGRLALVGRRGNVSTAFTYKTHGGKTVTRGFGVVGTFSEGMAAVSFQDQPENLLKRYRHRIHNRPESNSLVGTLDEYREAESRQAGEWGYMDSTGKIVIAPGFYKAGSFINGFALIQESENHFALINRQGQKVLDKYSRIIRDTLSDSLYIVHDPSDHYTIMDRKGNWQTELSKKEFKAAGNKLIPVRCKNKMWAFRSFTGFYITDSVYQSVRPFSEGLAAVCKDKLWGYLDTTGQIVLKPQFETASDFTSGRAFVSKGNTSKLITPTGTVLVKGELKVQEGFKDGVAIVCRNKKFGVMNTDGEWRVEPQFESLTGFNTEGFAIGTKASGKYSVSMEGEVQEIGEKKLLVSRKTRKAMRLREEIRDFNRHISGQFPGLCISDNPDHYIRGSLADTDMIFCKPFAAAGLVSYSGKIILEPAYQYIKPLGKGLYKVYFHNNTGYYQIGRGWLVKNWKE